MTTDYPDWLPGSPTGLLVRNTMVQADPFNIATINLSLWAKVLLIVGYRNDNSNPAPFALAVGGNFTGFLYTTGNQGKAVRGSKALWVVPVVPELDAQVGLTFSGTGASNVHPCSLLVVEVADVAVGKQFGIPEPGLSVGGSLKTGGAVGGNGTLTLLPAPPSGFAYRLHMFVTSAGACAVIDVATGGTVGAAPAAWTPNMMAGQLCFGSVEALNEVSVTNGVALTYDQIVSPVID